MKIVKKLYENREKLRVGEISLDREFSVLHKTHENRKKIPEIISFIQDRKNKTNVSFFKIFFFILYVRTGNDKH